MKQKTLPFDNSEIDILAEQLDPKDMFIIGFLKGFDRRVLKEFDKRGIWDYNPYNYQNAI